jgi:Na+-transporting NADH:ubiquinone oxidoreductase subunit C
MKPLQNIIARYAATKEIRMLLFLMILATLCTLLLGSANLAFQKASAVFNRRLYAVILEKYGIPFDKETIEATFSSHFETKKIGNTVYYVAKKQGAIVFKAQGAGLWSIIEVLLAVSADLERMEWLAVLVQAETPGLGGRIAEEEFQARFTGVEIRPQLNIVKFASGPNEVDAVTGASKTSEALEQIINNAIKELDQAFGKDRT